MLTPWKESYDQPRQHIKKQRHYFVNKCPSSQGYGFTSGHVWMWELDCEESWAPKNWCFWTVVLEKTLERLLGSKEIQLISFALVHPKGNQSWLFIGRTDAEAETPILWPPDAKSWLIWKDPDAGKDLRQKQKGMTEDEMTQWTWVWVNSRSWWWTGRPGVLQSVGSQRVEHDWVTELNWTELTESDLVFLRSLTLIRFWDYLAKSQKECFNDVIHSVYRDKVSWVIITVLRSLNFQTTQKVTIR